MSGFKLFTPLSIRDVALRNRIVVPPMHQYSAVKGFPTDWHLMNAGKFAAGGAGLVIVESTKVERRGCGTVGDLGIWDDSFVEPLARHLCLRFVCDETISGGGGAAKPEIRCRPRQARPQAMQFWDGLKARDAIRERLTTAFSTSPGGQI